jgi:hypothetical protein
MAALFGGRGKDGRARNAVHERAVGRSCGGWGWLRHGNLRQDESWREELCLSARQLGREK